MKWMRYLLAAVFLSLAVSCTDPLSPYPQDKDPGQDPDTDKKGFVLVEMGAFWA